MSGINLFIKYAYAPNIRGFCGLREIEIIHDGLFSPDAGQITEMNIALDSFTGAVPYLRLIASANNIRDPFDQRVVEAYWLGNDLLNKVSVTELYDHVRDRFKSKVRLKTIDLIAGQAAHGAKPHHSYHVFDAFSKTGGFERLGLSDIALNRIDECRIGWGTFDRYADNTKSQIVVKYEPIQLTPHVETGPRARLNRVGDDHIGSSLRSEIQQKTISNEIDGRKLFLDLKKSDIVTFHWSRICDVITKVQAAKLYTWTLYHLKLVNNSNILLNSD